MWASQFPKYRETRPPLVEDVIAVKDQLDPKFDYLTKAPLADPDGNKATIRFLRKVREQYVMTEGSDGKPTGWRAYYRDGKWVEEIPEKKSARKAPKKKSAKRRPAKKKASSAKSVAESASKKKDPVKKSRAKPAGGRKKAPASGKTGSGAKRTAAN